MNIQPISVELIDHMGSDLSVVNAARVSFAKESDWEDIPFDTESTGGVGGGTRELSYPDQKLISYLAKHNHFTPFCHAFLSFRIKTSFAMARQLVKHQVGLSWNEVSRRYVDDPPEYYMPESWRGKPVNAKQGSSDEVLTQFQYLDIPPFQPVPTDISTAVRDLYEHADVLYEKLIAGGVAPEQARFVLPLGGMTEWIWSGSLAAFARVCKLRLDPHAQKEVADVAKLIYDQVPPEFKYSWQALMEN